MAHVHHVFYKALIFISLLYPCRFLFRASCRAVISDTALVARLLDPKHKVGHQTVKYYPEQVPVFRREPSFNQGLVDLCLKDSHKPLNDPFIWKTSFLASPWLQEHIFIYLFI